MILVSLFASCCMEMKTDMLTNDYVETIPEHAKVYIEKLEENSILLSTKEIQDYNEKIKEKTDKIYDLSKESFTKEEIQSWIESYKLPSSQKYHQGKRITDTMREEILENRNLDAIEEEPKVQKGIVVRRTNLKSFPTEIHFYSQPSDTNFDSLQETEVRVNELVLLLHESKDQEWVFVMTKTYVGWLKQEDVVQATEEDIAFFLDAPIFGVITEPMVKVEDTLLDMSVKIPCIGKTKDGYRCILPNKENGKLEKKEWILSNNQIHIGYLPYTKRNVYIQAFKYEGMPYRWGGMDDGVDCSSFVSNVYRTFGFEFPRNTADQHTSVGEILSLENKTIEEKKQILLHQEPNLLYQEGHVLIYLGQKDGKDYVIDASGNSEVLKVAEEELTRSNYLNKINKLVRIR